MPKSLSSLEELNINGVEQWIQIQSKDSTQPILLILHGGPGYAMMPLFHHRNAVLEDHFIVVNWDQRGAGRSYRRTIPKKSMTFQQFLDDLNALTQILKQRFRRQRIYLLGHSWGTMMGLSAAKAHPKDYYAFVGVGQVVGPIINEIVMYEWELGEARRQNHKKAIRELTLIGHPDQFGEYPGKGPGGADPYDISDYWMGYFGGDLYGKHGTDQIDNWMLNQPVYLGKWGTKWINGNDFSKRVWDDDDAWKLDFRQSVTTLDIPAFFLHGRHDYDTPGSLVQAYVPTLDAPQKELIWFENSAHFPFYEESERFNQIMIDVVKKSTFP